MLRAKDRIFSIPLYHPPLAGRDGLRLDFNENTVGCSPRVLDRLRQIGFEDLARYPEKACAETKMAEFLGVTESELLLTNGTDEAIHLLCQTYLEAGDQALIVAPTYSMYRIYMTGTGANVTAVPMEPSFEFPFAGPDSRNPNGNRDRKSQQSPRHSCSDRSIACAGELCPARRHFDR